MISVFTALLQFYNCVILLQARELHCNKTGLMPERNSPMVFALHYLYCSQASIYSVISVYTHPLSILQSKEWILLPIYCLCSRNQSPVVACSLLNALALSCERYAEAWKCRIWVCFAFYLVQPVTAGQIKDQVCSGHKQKYIHWLQPSNVSLYQRRGCSWE